jgi:CubicO group peptidase (beta-lactamase class C family)
MPVSRLDPAMPGMSNKVEFLPGIRKCWGLGLMVNLEDLPGGRRAGSLAWAGLGNTYFWIDPASGIAGVLLSQILPFADPRIMRLFAEFEKAVYDTIGS